MTYRVRLLSLLFLLTSFAAAQHHPAPAQRHTATAKTKASTSLALAQRIGQLLADPAVIHSHWGISVVELDGRPVYALNDNQYFTPASNTKLLTTAATFDLLPTDTATYTTNVVTNGAVDTHGVLTGDLVILGSGDPTLSGRSYPYGGKTERTSPPLQALIDLADQIAQNGVKSVSGNIVGDDTFFLDERYGNSWGWDDLMWSYGAPVSALSINDNVVYLNLLPDPAHAGQLTPTWNPEIPYYTLESTMTLAAAGGKGESGLEKMPGSSAIRAWGNASNTKESQGYHTALAIDDPALYAALALKQLLEERGVTIAGAAKANHRKSVSTISFYTESREPISLQPISLTTIAAPIAGRRVVATHVSPPINQDLVVTNKVSQNLHAELALRELGKLCGNDGSFAQGTRVVRQFLLNAGVREDEFNFYDGSGMSSDDVITPRAITTLLTYAAHQPWGLAWKQTFPVAGVDGTLSGRFLSSPLKGRLEAKTGTLSGVNALSGYLTARTGKTLAFSVLVNKHRPASDADRRLMDQIVDLVAAQN